MRLWQDLLGRDPAARGALTIVAAARGAWEEGLKQLCAAARIHELPLNLEAALSVPEPHLWLLEALSVAARDLLCSPYRVALRHRPGIRSLWLYALDAISGRPCFTTQWRGPRLPPNVLRALKAEREWYEEEHELLGAPVVAAEKAGWEYLGSGDYMHAFANGDVVAKVPVSCEVPEGFMLRDYALANRTPACPRTLGFDGLVLYQEFVDGYRWDHWQPGYTDPLQLGKFLCDLDQLARLGYRPADLDNDPNVLVEDDGTMKLVDPDFGSNTPALWRRLRRQIEASYREDLRDRKQAA